MLLDRILGAARLTPTLGTQSYLFAPRKSSAGIVMSEETALTFSAVWSAQKVISETVAMLPWRVYRETPGGRQLLDGSDLDRLLHLTPNSVQTAFTFREYLIACALMHGNGYAEIVRNMTGRPVELIPIHPSKVTPKFDGALTYEVRLESGAVVVVPSEDMFHLRGPTSDGMIGRSLISIARESWGLGIAAEQFAGAFFGNGAVPGMVIKQAGNPSSGMSPDISREAATSMLESFEKRFQGAGKAGRTWFAEYGMEIHPVGIPQKDAQFLETRQFSVTDVARWFRLPPHKIGDLTRATFSNIEEQGIEFVTDAIQPWITRLEQEAWQKLVVAERGIITKISMNALLRGNAQARGEFYRQMRDLGALSINEIRRLEDWNEIDGGDLRLVPVNMQSIERAASGVQNAAMGIAADTHTRMARRAMSALERAKGKGESVPEWCESFYPSHESAMAEALTPTVSLMLAIIGRDGDAAGLALQHAQAECERGRIDAVGGVSPDPVAAAGRLSRLVAECVK